jgi:hypothetical protein
LEHCPPQQSNTEEELEDQLLCDYLRTLPEFNPEPIIYERVQLQDQNNFNFDESQALFNDEDDDERIPCAQQPPEVIQEPQIEQDLLELMSSQTYQEQISRILAIEQLNIEEELQNNQRKKKQNKRNQKSLSL